MRQASGLPVAEESRPGCPPYRWFMKAGGKTSSLQAERRMSANLFIYSDMHLTCGRFNL